MVEAAGVEEGWYQEEAMVILVPAGSSAVSSVVAVVEAAADGPVAVEAEAALVDLVVEVLEAAERVALGN